MYFRLASIGSVSPKQIRSERNVLFLGINVKSRHLAKFFDLMVEERFQ